MALQQGELIEWNDARGFGFIRPDTGAARVFVHISQIDRIATRPRLGDRVSYGVGKGRDGGTAAINVTIAGANPVKARALARGNVPPPKRHHLPIRLYGAGLLSGLLLLGALIGPVPLPLVLAYLVMGGVSVAFYFDDKRQAETGGWRTSEARLHGIDLLFGIIGGLVAQQLFRHKTAKLEFALTSCAIALLHGLVLVGLLTGRLSIADLASLIPG